LDEKDQAVWTPKRILILVAGFAVFLVGYAVYAFFLGGIDGLPLLPDMYQAQDEDVPPPAIAAPSTIEIKFQQAFGPACPELQRSIKLVDTPRNGWGLAADSCVPQPDGRVRLTPFSAYIVPKKQAADAKFPEIFTIRCEEVYLTMDRKIKDYSELSSSKIVSIEMCAKRSTPKTISNGPGKELFEVQSIPITIRNNRSTPEESDDLEVHIPEGPLYFDDTKNLVWTDGAVQLLDKQTVQETKITAYGMELHLSRDGKDDARGKARRKSDGITGVNRVILRSDVAMYLYVDSGNGFLGDVPAGRKPAARKTNPATKAKLTITTKGRFVYDLRKELAQFESPGRESKTPHREQVWVSRSYEGANKAVFQDILLCNFLELWFVAKAPEKGSKANSDRTAKEISKAHAEAWGADTITMTLSSENTHVYDAKELFYEAATADRGSKTILRGALLNITKDAHQVFSPEITLVAANKKGEGQMAVAKGPGHLDLMDPKSKDARYPQQAFWSDQLVYTKDRQGTKVFDLLVLSGDAAFVDKDHDQELRAKRLHVWLEPMPAAAPDPAVKTETVPGGPAQKPARVEGFENVTALSPDMRITKTDHLLVHFTDGIVPTLPDSVPTDRRKAASPPAQAAKAVPAGVSKKKVETPEGPRVTVAGDTEPVGPEINKTAENSRRPIDLQARQVTAYVTRQGNVNFLRELVAEGTVHVQQEGAQTKNKDGKVTKDKGVDIKGEMLNLLHNPQGDVLYVFGDAREMARLRLGEMFLAGPKVTINQLLNMAEVKGLGAMEMPSKSSFDGGKPAQPGTRLRIHWNQDMMFDGKYAYFHGGVVAYQDTSSLRCQDLQVTMDRVVSFKEGQQSGQSANVEFLVCDRSVYIVNEKKENGKLTAYHRLEGREVRLDNPNEVLLTAGPGRVVFLGAGSASEPMARPQESAAPGKAANPPANKEMHMTRIDFVTRMFSSNENKSVRISKFYDSVEVYHFPADQPSMQMDPDRPPRNGFYMRCELLTVYTRKLADGKTRQIMEGKKKVFFRTQECFGHADVVKYNEGQEQVILEGNPAVLYKQRPNLPPQELRGNKILYNRRTGAITVDGIEQIQSRLERREPASIIMTWLHAHCENEPLFRLCAAARDDG
jgi:hypothetical protein